MNLTLCSNAVHFNTVCKWKWHIKLWHIAQKLVALCTGVDITLTTEVGETFDKDGVGKWET